MIIANAPTLTKYTPTFKVVVAGEVAAKGLDIHEARKLCDSQTKPAIVVDEASGDSRFMNHANTAYHEQYTHLISERDNYDEV